MNEVGVVKPNRDLPLLPVARAVWIPRPNLELAAAAWIYAGGSHHSSFSQSLTTEHMEDFAGMAGMEFLCIDAGTKLRSFETNFVGTKPCIT